MVAINGLADLTKGFGRNSLYLLTQVGRNSEANHAYELAIGLAESETLRPFLQQQANVPGPYA